MIEIKNGAIFIADVHYQKDAREEFYTFLSSIKDKKIKTDQLILMGDIFDLLVGGVDYTIKVNKKLIDLIDKISKDIEIVYIEGNHDFNLTKIFTNIKIIPFNKQPMVVKFFDKYIIFSHGDNFQGLRYKIYTTLIRSKTLLFILNKIDKILKNKISKNILKKQINKNLCKKSKDIQNISKQKFKIYDITFKEFDLILEGHYHEDREFIYKDRVYKFLPSFACDKVATQIFFKEEIVFNQIKG